MPLRRKIFRSGPINWRSHMVTKPSAAFESADCPMIADAPSRIVSRTVGNRISGDIFSSWREALVAVFRRTQFAASRVLARPRGSLSSPSSGMDDTTRAACLEALRTSVGVD